MTGIRLPDSNLNVIPKYKSSVETETSFMTLNFVPTLWVLNGGLLMEGKSEMDLWLWRWFLWREQCRASYCPPASGVERTFHGTPFDTRPCQVTDKWWCLPLTWEPETIDGWSHGSLGHVGWVRKLIVCQHKGCVIFMYQVWATQETETERWGWGGRELC